MRHEGLRQGMYVRLALRGVPAEFCSGFRADCPVVLGGLQPHEGTMGIIHVRHAYKWTHTHLHTHIYIYYESLFG